MPLFLIIGHYLRLARVRLWL